MRARVVVVVAGAATFLAVAASASSRATGPVSAAAACAPRWHAVNSGATLPDFWSVAAVSPTDVWAVGGTGPKYVLGGGYRRKGVIAHWDGRRLRIVRESRTLAFYGIAAASGRDVWVVGSDGDTDRPLVMRWNGRQWRVLATPRLRFVARFIDVVAISRSEVWAVGGIGKNISRPLALHWNGQRLRANAIWHEGALSAIDATSSGDLWAVGSQGIGIYDSVNNEDGLVMHGDGRRWKEVPAVYRDAGDRGYETGDHFDGIDALSRSEAWATHVGSAVSGDVQRWDGRTWKVVRAFPESVLADIAAVASDDVWVVGPTSYLEEKEHPLIVHWDGRSWRVQQTPFRRLRGTLSSLSVISATDIWAVGDNLMARYSC